MQHEGLHCRKDAGGREQTETTVSELTVPSFMKVAANSITEMGNAIRVEAGGFYMEVTYGSTCNGTSRLICFSQVMQLNGGLWQGLYA